MKKLSKKLILVVTIITAVILASVIYFSYALWQSNFTQSGTNLNTYDCFNISFSDNSGGVVNITNGYPVSDAVGLKGTEYVATIKNTCGTPAAYSVIINELSTSTLDDAFIKIGYDNKATLLSEFQDAESSALISGATKGKILTTGILNGDETKTVSLRAWVSDAATTDEANKNFSFKVSVYAVAGGNSSNYLNQKVLGNVISNASPNENGNTIYKDPDFSNPSPMTLTYAQNVEENVSVSYNSSISGNKTLGTGYTFDADSGQYTLTSTSTNQSYNNSAVGKYTCNSTSTTCTTMYKINSVKVNSSSNNYTMSSGSTYTSTLTSSSNRKVGTGYSFNPSTGYFTITGTTYTSVSYSSSYRNYYTCNNNTGTNCTTIYRINTVSGTSVTNSTRYTRSINYNYITNVDRYTSVADTETSDSGLFASEDDDGTTYYFRGNVQNNYVSFAGYIWRIVRVNGDGTTRLILDDDTGESKMFDDPWGETYSHGSACTKSSPCISAYDATTKTFTNNKDITNSTIKDYLENDWYQEIADYDSYIAQGSFCNDVSISSSTMTTIYKAQTRMENNTPTFKCEDNSSEPGGGYYKSKIGLLTADEMMFAGYGTDILPSTNNYLFYNGSFWTMTPDQGYSSYRNVFAGNNGEIRSAGTDDSLAVRPVINLKADTKVSGSGTKKDPYVVSSSNSLSQKIISTNTLQTSAPNFTYGAPSSSYSSNLSGLFSAADDLGTSYYLRGNITNNYVNFAGLTWRVVRINGDGTVRMVTNDTVGSSAFNLYSTYNRKYVGYTYDNTLDDDGFVIRGTDSTIKSYIDNWYQTTIIDANLDGYVASEIFCNDTSTGSGTQASTLYYGSYTRTVSSKAPSFSCPTTDKTYGGKYKLKAGLLSRDEMIMAGLGYTSGSTYNSTSANYLYKSGTYWWSMSPYSSNQSSTANVSRAYNGYSFPQTVTTSRYVRPVINLRADVYVTSGNGTSSSPYEISY